MRHSFKLGEVELILWTDLDEGTLVACAVTVVWCGKDCNAPAVVLNFVAFHTDLVRSDDSLKTVVLTEALGDIGTKLKTNTALAGAAARLGLRVSPKHLHHKTLLTRLALVMAVEFANVVQGDLIIGEKTAVQDEILFADQCGQG